MPDAKIYVLAGYDGTGAFHEELAAYAKRKNVIIIRPKAGESFEDAVKKIIPPANVIVASHGDSYYENLVGDRSGFWWGKKDKELTSYETLFKNLPRDGIGYVNIGACKGGSFTHSDIRKIPPGTIVFSSVSSQAYGWNSNATQVSETKDLTNITDCYLEGLDNIDPIKFAARQNKEDGRKTIEAASVLSNFIAIGGPSYSQICIIDELNALGAKASMGIIDNEALRHAVRRVKEHFDPNILGEKNTTPSSGPAIDKVAAGIASGKAFNLYADPVGDVRIGYALAFAYLDESGGLADKISRARFSPAQLDRVLVDLDNIFGAARGIRIDKDDLIRLQKKLSLLDNTVKPSGEMDKPTGDILEKINEVLRRTYHVQLRDIDFKDPNDAAHIIFEATLQQEIKTYKKSLSIIDTHFLGGAQEADLGLSVSPLPTRQRIASKFSGLT